MATRLDFKQAAIGAWIVSAGYVVIVFGLLIVYLRKIPPALDRNRPKQLITFSMSVVCFATWMYFYLFKWRYSAGELSDLSVNTFITYSRQFFPYGIMSEFQEEASYRGLLFALSIKMFGERKSIYFQSTIFLLMHYVGVAHGNMDMMRSVSTFFLGVIFCFMRTSTMSLWVPTCFHSIWNLVSIFLYENIEVRS